MSDIYLLINIVCFGVSLERLVDEDLAISHSL